MAGLTVWWASLMVGQTRRVWVLTPFVGTEARFASQRALRCWDATGAAPNSYTGYGHSLVYDGGRWGIGRSDNTPEGFAVGAEADEEYSRWWRRGLSLIPAGATERLAARRTHLTALNFVLPTDLAELEAKCWDIIDRRLPRHARRDAVRAWYLRWQNQADPIIAHESEWTHLYNREYPATWPGAEVGQTWWAADIAEYLTVAQEMAALGWKHPVRVADAAAEVIFATWVLRAVQDGSLAYGAD